MARRDHGLPSFAKPALARHKLVAIILAGYDGDGAAALRDVKGVVGITIAQKVDTARQQDMPLTAIAGGYIDLVLPIDEIAKEITRIARSVPLGVSPASVTTVAPLL